MTTITIRNRTLNVETDNGSVSAPYSGNIEKDLIEISELCTLLGVNQDIINQAKEDFRHVL